MTIPLSQIDIGTRKLFKITFPERGKNVCSMKTNFDPQVGCVQVVDVRRLIYDPILIPDIFLFPSDWQSCFSHNEEGRGI